MRLCRRELGAWLLAGLTRRAFALTVRPKLLVLVVLEQLPPNFLQSAAPQLAPGGFRRLLEKGTVYHDCRHSASTFTSSSLATLATGAWPAQHGIIADRWYERSTQTAISASGDALMATTLADELIAEPHSRVSVIGLDPAHAGIFAGTGDARLFWMDEHGQFASNTPPDWLPAFNAATSPEAAHNAKWMALGAAPAAPPLRVLTYGSDRPGDFLALYKASPFGQAALFDLASEIVVRERLGQNNTLDFLCILAGSTARLGYETGARSPLMHQLLLRLDQRLEAFLTLLSHTPGENAFAFALAGGHGAPPAPDPDARPVMAVDGASVVRALQSANLPVEKYIYPFLYLRGANAANAALRLSAGRSALAHPAVAGYYTANDDCSVHNAWQRRFRNSFHPVRSGDVMLSYHPGFIEDFGEHRGISYGSLYNYDVRVPLLFYGPQFRAATFEAPVESIDLAPTLAAIMGVPPPSSSTGRVLSEALAP